MEPWSVTSEENALALEILEQIQLGNTSFDGLDSIVGKNKDFHTVLNKMRIRDGDSESHGMLTHTRDSNGHLFFNITGTTSGRWHRDLHEWLRDHNYDSIL